MLKKCLILIFTIITSFTVIGCNQEEGWKESPLFESGNYTMIGEEGRLGFIYDDSEVIKFYPDKVHKYMWHFWGTKEELEHPLKVIATHETGGDSITLFGGDGNDVSPLNGADMSLPTNMSLPKSGMWKLDAYFDDKLFGSVYVKVHEKK
ncbi:hypothetical protein JFL43_10420 [Viridibacillus sp. YIM B01967]|uniref:DUF4871 domain-containing protein n=1 Tax=Viridibacillus soli TaxID=2798301 RepID=A0ABS1H8B0_9BACL|nr:hypothetical protein [Viridibacillus soli]MBK3495258.1 hypothetical protein [Viridibacillus soli]